MQNLVETLGNMTPVIIVAGMTAFMTLETWRPYFKYGPGRSRQRWRNVGMVAISVPLGAAAGGLTALPIVWSEANNFGLLHRILGQSPLAIALGILVIDLCAYTVHVTLHKVPTLWRIHRLHHADTELDATSAIRLHPFELLLLLGSLAMVLPLLGVSMLSYVIYNTLGLLWFLLNHSNIQYPVWFERWGSLLMSTPNWHRVHHSRYQPETDSHYGCMFSLWDRLFGTAGKSDVEKIQFGLDRFRGPGEQTVWKMLKMPFRGL